MPNFVFLNLGILIIIATGFAYIARLLKQPLIPAYILSGILLGPFGLALINDAELIKTLSEIGIAFLLFVVGLELDVRKLKNIGVIASIGGLTQVLIVFTLGFIISLVLGFLYIEAIYLGIIVAFSSTMVVVKILADNREIDTLHGKIIIGILLMQDIISIFALSLLTTINNLTASFIIYSILKALLLIILVVVFSKFIFPRVYKFAAKSGELLFLLSLATAFFFSLLAYWLNFSIAIGAFMGGVALAGLPYNYEIISKVVPVRDFFATLFFVSLGMGLTLTNMGNIILIFLIFLVVVVILKSYLTTLLTAFFGYSKRTAFQTGLSLGQISEFSLIIVAQGLVLGHVSQQIFNLTILLAIFSIGLTSYVLKYDNLIYQQVSRYLNFLDNFANEYRNIEYKRKRFDYQYIVIGYDRIGYIIVKMLHHLQKKILVMDYNPDIIRKLITEKTPYLYGDVGDIETLNRLNFKKCRMVISTVPGKEANLLLIKKAKSQNPKILVFVTAYDIEVALSFYEAGADYVILPHFLGGDRVAMILKETNQNIHKLLRHKARHLQELKERKELGHKHPKRYINR